ncbi:MAG: serine/threonine protein kinase, partial [Myxococcales bacterium]
MELLAGDRLGKYEIVGRLAAGGMAEVYLARSIGVGGFAKTVALKRMLPDLAQEPGFREMFMHEASIAARLNHANIIQIFDFAEERGELYLAMEFVHGVTLRQLLRDVQKPPPNSNARVFIPPMLAAHIGRCIARALAHAWEAPDENGQPSKLIHRDVSPHNILLSYDGDVKLADFGIARPADRRTSVGTIKGKLVYMAPEQITGGQLDARTDVFALGIVMHETATNSARSLFEAADQRAIMEAIHRKQIIPPDRMDPDFPKGFSSVILKALERDAAKRYQSAAELADALGDCIHRESKSPLDFDLASFMRTIYGAPPAVRGLRAATTPPSPAPSASGCTEKSSLPDSELARRGDDPH